MLGSTSMVTAVASNSVFNLEGTVNLQREALYPRSLTTANAHLLTIRRHL